MFYRALVFSCWFFVGQSDGATLEVFVTTPSGEPVENAAISAFHQNPIDSVIPPPETASIDQIDEEFIDHVTVVQLGTAVYFPNHDNIRHHVYSFSPAKPFELPLYKGTPANPVVFDNIGVVTLGCNIHDWMSAYIYVVDTHLFSVSKNDGRATIDLPAGEYEIRIWHPRLDGSSTELTRQIDLKSDTGQPLNFQLKLKSLFKPRRGPLPIHSRGRYR